VAEALKNSTVKALRMMTLLSSSISFASVFRKCNAKYQHMPTLLGIE